MPYDVNVCDLTRHCDSYIFLKELLQHDLTRRYGCLKNGARDIKKSKWFAKVEMDWEALIRKDLTAPIIPKVANEDDTSNFEKYPESDAEDDDPPLKEVDDPFVFF